MDHWLQTKNTMLITAIKHSFICYEWRVGSYYFCNKVNTLFQGLMSIEMMQEMYSSSTEIKNLTHASIKWKCCYKDYHPSLSFFWAFQVISITNMTSIKRGAITCEYEILKICIFLLEIIVFCWNILKLCNFFANCTLILQNSYGFDLTVPIAQ